MLESEVVGELGSTLDLYAGGVLLHEEDGSLVGIAVQVGVDQQEVSDVADGNIPLLTVDLVAAIALDSGGLALSGVRTGVSLGDGVSVTTLALAGGDQILIDLLLRTEFHGERGLGNGVPDSAGGHTQLLADEHLLKQGHALAAVLLAVVGGVEAPVLNFLGNLLVGLRSDAVVLLALPSRRGRVPAQ